MTTPAQTRFADRDLQRFAEQTRQEFKRLEGVPFLDGALVELPALAAAGVVLVTHGLGRTPRGWFPVRIDRAPGTTSQLALYRRTNDRWDATAISLYSTGDYALVHLWVY